MGIILSGQNSNYDGTEVTGPAAGPPVASGGESFALDAVIHVICTNQRVAALGGTPSPSGLTQPAQATLFLSADGAGTWVPAETKTFSQFDPTSARTFRLADHLDRDLSTHIYYDSSGVLSGVPVNNPTSQPRSFRAPWSHYMVVAGGSYPDAVTFIGYVSR